MDRNTGLRSRGPLIGMFCNPDPIIGLGEISAYFLRNSYLLSETSGVLDSRHKLVLFPRGTGHNLSLVLEYGTSPGSVPGYGRHAMASPGRVGPTNVHDSVYNGAENLTTYLTLLVLGATPTR